MRTPPSYIEVVLHYYYSPLPMELTPAVMAAIRCLISNGIMKEDTDSSVMDDYLVTVKGKAWVEMICHTPFPVLRESWHDPRFDEQGNPFT